jgi:hypothetical protein
MSSIRIHFLCIRANGVRSADSLLTILIMSLLQHLHIAHFFASHTSIKVQKWGFDVASCSRQRWTTFDPVVQMCHVRDAEWSHKLSLHFGILGWKVAKIRHFSNLSSPFSVRWMWERISRLLSGNGRRQIHPFVWSTALSRCKLTEVQVGHIELR